MNKVGFELDLEGQNTELGQTLGMKQFGHFARTEITRMGKCRRY